VASGSQSRVIRYARRCEAPSARCHACACSACKKHPTKHCVIDGEILSAPLYPGSGRFVRHRAQIQAEAARAAKWRVGDTGRFGVSFTSSIASRRLVKRRNRSAMLTTDQPAAAALGKISRGRTGRPGWRRWSGTDRRARRRAPAAQPPIRSPPTAIVALDAAHLVSLDPGNL
jgi:hypothetical protein